MPMELIGLIHALQQWKAHGLIEWSIENLITVQFRDYTLKKWDFLNLI